MGEQVHDVIEISTHCYLVLGVVQVQCVVVPLDQVMVLLPASVQTPSVKELLQLLVVYLD